MKVINLREVIDYKCVLGVSSTCLFSFLKVVRVQHKLLNSVEITKVNVKAFSYAEGQATGLHGYFVIKM